MSQRPQRREKSDRMSGEGLVPEKIVETLVVVVVGPPREREMQEEREREKKGKSPLFGPLAPTPIAPNPDRPLSHPITPEGRALCLVARRGREAQQNKLDERKQLLLLTLSLRVFIITRVSREREKKKRDEL